MLLKPASLSSISLRNRLVRSATWEGACDEAGRPTEKTIEYYRALSKGGVGLIISGYTFVSADGKQQRGQAGLCDDAFEMNYRAIANAVHDEGGAVLLQLVHAGGQANEANSGCPPVAPSAVATPQYPVMPEALSEERILKIIEAFAEAAFRVKKWGFDGVQLHAAHGYLINQFLSPLTNQRTDSWGGSAANRRRFLLETFRSVRVLVGEGFPVLVKLNACDHLDGGLSLEESLEAAKVLDDNGVDAVEISSGTAASGDIGPTRTGIDSPQMEAWNAPLAAEFKAVLRCPVISVGGFRTYEMASQSLDSGQVDFVAMSRPFIREPDLCVRWMSGDTQPATCVSCNRCFVAGSRGGIRCLKRKG